MRHFQIIVDENMPRRFTLMLQSWVSAGQIGYEVGRKGIQDDEIIPRILLEVKRTTFLTQDRRIYFRERPHPGYCLIIVPELSVSEIATLVRRLRKFCQATERQMPEAPTWGWQDNHPIRINLRVNSASICSESYCQMSE